MIDAPATQRRYESAALLSLCLVLLAQQFGLFKFLGASVLAALPTLSLRDENACYALATICVEWLVFAIVWFCVRRVGLRPFAFVGVARNRIQLGCEVILGVGLGLIEALYCVVPTRWHNLLFIKPLSVEVIEVIGISLSAAITEEIIFRGYLQRMITHASGNVWLAIEVQAVAFAFAHISQGTYSYIVILLESLVTGYIAYRLGNLRALIVAHCTVDIIAYLT
jgi:membrane protease YdiL (CAAX protease family)